MLGELLRGAWKWWREVLRLIEKLLEFSKVW
jgi:hypothetical protein